jgi:hypothetical protein
MSHFKEISKYNNESFCTNNLYLLHIAALHRNLLSLNFNDAPATKSFVQLSALEAESIVEYFISTMYAGQESSHTMNGNMIESSLIPGSTGISPSPIIMQQHANDMYGNGNMSGTSLRTHSSKFPVSSFINFRLKKKLFLFFNFFWV